MWKLNNIHLINQCIKKEITRIIRNCQETNGNENTTYQNIWNTAKAESRRKFTAANKCIKKEKDFKLIN